MTIPAWVMQLTAVVLLGGTVASPPACARTLNGFDLSDASVPADDVFRGGPPRDGIPALTNPHYVKAAEATFLESGDRILGARLDGKPYAYPVGIMNYHEIINHSRGANQWLITYCPLCGTGMVFDASVGGENLTFGVSGLLYNNDLLM